MNNAAIDLFVRKVTAIYAATMISSVALAIALSGSSLYFSHTIVLDILSYTFLTSLYIGAFCVLYGTPISLLIDSIAYRLEREMQRRIAGIRDDLLQDGLTEQAAQLPGQPNPRERLTRDTLYVAIHGLFGIFPGLVFKFPAFVLCGVFAASLYALADRWTQRRLARGQGIKRIWLLPVLVCTATLVYLDATTPEPPPLPPFTKAAAVAFATAGEGTEIDRFPKQEGVWRGEIDGYSVVRRTRAEESPGKHLNKVYLVTFSESWQKGSERGSYTLTYLVQRGSLTFHRQEGDTPPYLLVSAQG
ncbi:hypothetical protein [Paenibacillus sp. 1P07SE]|uniref:hypothetical protein n=1 Tax=Paenibacillus sp. 1P07SE TaxID=3132209 RepID=UPI0039A4F2CC